MKHQKKNDLLLVVTKLTEKKPLMLLMLKNIRNH